MDSVIVRQVLYFIVFIFFLCLLVRLIFDWIQVFSRGWRPRGPVLVLAEGVYTATDPPLRAIRKVIPPVRLGSVSLDLAFMVLFFVTIILMGILS